MLSVESPHEEKRSQSKDPCSHLGHHLQILNPRPVVTHVLEQLNKTSAHISILELLKISNTRKEILENTLFMSTIPKDIDAS